MIININAVKNESAFFLFENISVTMVEDELWATYGNNNKEIFIVKRANGEWGDTFLITEGVNPTITYDGTYVNVYFSNSSKIQKASFTPELISKIIYPLQNWDGLYDNKFGIHKNVTINNFADEWPIGQPQVSNIIMTDEGIWWNGATSFSGITKFYRIYENNVLIGETNLTTLAYKVKPLTEYSITSVYTYLRTDLESYKVSTISPAMEVVNEEIAFDHFTGAIGNAKLESLEVDSMNIHEAIELLGSISGYVNNSIFFTYEVMSIDNIKDCTEIDTYNTNKVSGFSSQALIVNTYPVSVA